MGPELQISQEAMELLPFRPEDRETGSLIFDLLTMSDESFPDDAAFESIFPEDFAQSLLGGLGDRA